jgi:hypothetical protein
MKSQRIILVFLALALAGCAAFQPTEEPIPSQWYRFDQPSDTLIVFLRGAGGGEGQFDRAGVMDVLKESGLGWHAVTVDAHLGYYRQETVVDRINEDILTQARDMGYRHFWLSGPSLGGFGSLFFWCRSPHDDIAGLIALAPHLGGRAIIDEIRAAGGAAEWTPDGAGEEHEVDLWQCLQQTPEVPIWLAWGRDDRMAPANELLAELLPEDRVIVTDGGHRWSTWTPLWVEIFARIAAHRDAD